MQNRPPLKKPRWRGYVLQLFLSIVLPLSVLLLAVVFGSQSLHHEAMRSLVADRDLKTARSASNAVQQELFHLSDTLGLMSRSLDEAGQIDARLFPPADVAADFDGGVALFSENGRVLSSTSAAMDWPGLPAQSAAFFSSIAANDPRPAFLTRISTSPSSPSFTFIGIATPGGGALVGAVDSQKLLDRTIGDLVASGQTTVLVITSPTGAAHFDVLYRGGPVKVDEAHPTHPGFIEALNGQSGVDFLHTSQNEHVVAYTPIQPTGWGLVIEEAWEDIASPLLNTTQSAPLVIVPVFLLALFALWLGARSIVTPLQKLESQAADLAKGDFEAIRKPVGGIEEIRYLQSELVEMVEKLEAAQNALRSYLGAVTAGIENERRSLARELHDDTIQTLIALNQRIQILVMNTPEGDKDQANQLLNLIQQSMTNLRRLIRGLRPIFLEDLGLVASLEMLVREMAESAGIDFAFSSTGVERPLSPQNAMSLYRMVQESLNNVARHSGAAHARVDLVWSAGLLTVSAQDDGRGFDPPGDPSEFAARGHYGLLGLHERAELIGARLKIQSAPGKGTDVNIQVDLTADHVQ